MLFAPAAHLTLMSTPLGIRGNLFKVRFYVETLFVDNPIEDGAQTEEERIQQQMDYVRALRLKAKGESPTPVTKEELWRAVKAAKKGKAPGPDKIKAKILIHCFQTIEEVLLNHVNHILKSGIFPKIYKMADIVLLYKGGGKDPSEEKSYRPISLLSCIGKMIDRIITDRLLQHKT